MQRLPGDPADPVEHRPFDEAHAEVRQKGRDTTLPRPRALGAVELAPQIEERDRLSRDVSGEPRRVPDDVHHVGQVLLERRGRVLGEPFRRQPLGRKTPGGRSSDGDPRAR